MVIGKIVCGPGAMSWSSWEINANHGVVCFVGSSENVRGMIEVVWMIGCTGIR